MGLVYLGTAPFAADVLAGLAAAGRRPDLVLTRPDARQGRGRTLAPPAAAVTATGLGIPVLQPEDVNAPEVAEAVAEAAGDDGRRVLCAYGALIGDRLLSGPPILNVHPSLLPRWRGAAPIERAIQAGDAETGVCIMRLVAELDAGPVYARTPVPIDPQDTYGTLAPRLIAASVALLTGVLDRLPEPEPQPEAGVTYAEKITAADRTLDLSGDPAAAVRTVRALHPHIGARIALPGGAFLGVEEAEVAPDGTFRPVRVRPAGGRSMGYDEYVRGHGPIGR